MTTKRSQAVAQAQDRRLAALAVARDRRPGPRPGTLRDPALAMRLAGLAALEHAATLARLARMASAEPADDYLRRTQVIVNAITSVLAEDIRTGGTGALDEIYRRVTTIADADKEDT